MHSRDVDRNGSPVEQLTVWIVDPHLEPVDELGAVIGRFDVLRRELRVTIVRLDVAIEGSGTRIRADRKAFRRADPAA